MVPVQTNYGSTHRVAHLSFYCNIIHNSQKKKTKQINKCGTCMQWNIIQPEKGMEYLFKHQP